jgi:hypothetical protein
MLANTTETPSMKKKRDTSRAENVKNTRWWLNRDFPELDFIEDKDLSDALNKWNGRKFPAYEDIIKHAETVAKKRIAWEEKNKPQDRKLTGNRGRDGSLLPSGK